VRNSVITQNKHTVNKVANSTKINFLGEKRDLSKTRIQLANFSKKNILYNTTVVSSEKHT